MAQVWSQRLPIFRFQAGEPLPQAQKALVGPPRDATRGVNSVRGYDETATRGTLRVASAPRFQFPPPTTISQALYQAQLEPPANGTIITPLDVPFVVPVDAPVLVSVTPIRAPDLLPGGTIEEVVLVTLWEAAGCPYAYGGTLWITVPPETPTAIPDWTGACSAIASPSPVFTWLDADLATAVGTWAGTYQPRPRRAAAVQHAEQENVHILCHWTQ